MPNPRRSRLDVTPMPEHYEIDFAEASRALSEEIEREHDRNLNDFREEVALEEELNAPLVDRARELGLIIENLDR